MKIRYHSVIEKAFFALLPMQIILIMISSINSIIDGIVVSNYVGPTALAVIALFMPIERTLTTINTIFLGGAQILCGQYIGKNQVRKSVGVFSTAVFFLVAIGLGITLTCVLFCGPIASLFVRDAVIAADLRNYILGYAPGIVPMMLVPLLTAFLQMERQETRSYVAMCSMIVLNVVLDILFVSVFHWGTLGLGLATAVGNISGLLILGSYYVFHDSAISFDRKEIHPEELKNVIHIGFPGAVSQLGQTVRALLLNTIMLTFVGNDGIAAFSAVCTFGSVYWAFSGGVSTAVRVLSSIYVGEEDRVGLHTIMKTALMPGLGLVCGVTALCVLCAPLFTVMFYGPDAGVVYRMTLIGFILLPLSAPFSCICTVFANYYQCLKRIKIVNILMLADGLVGAVLISYILTPILGMNGIWLGQIGNGLLTTLIIFVYTVQFRKHRPTSISDLLVLEDGFGVPQEDKIDIEITDMNDVINLSESIVSFSRDHGIDKRRSMLAGLCVEEMAGNIVQHGFDGKKAYNIDVRVIYKQDALLIRLKDNCRLFNPKEVQDLFDPQDVTHNIGLRIVSKIAQTMSYNNCLGINVLNITI